MQKFLYFIIVINFFEVTAEANSLNTDTMMQVLCADDAVSKQSCAKVRDEHGREIWKDFSVIHASGEVSKITDFRDLEWLLGEELDNVKKTALIEQIYNMPEFFSYCNYKLLSDLWTTQTQNTAAENPWVSSLTGLTWLKPEPRYLRAISNFLHVRLLFYSEKIEKELKTKEELIYHAYNLLFVMNAFIKYCHATSTLVYNEKTKQAARYAGYHSSLSDIAVYKLGDSFDPEKIKKVVWTGRLKIPESMIKLSATKIGSIPFDQNKSPGKYHRFVYRTIEKLTLLYLIDHFENFFNYVYKEAQSYSSFRPDEALHFFDSWESFKIDSKKNISKSGKYYFTPWFEKVESVLLMAGFE